METWRKLDNSILRTICSQLDEVLHLQDPYHVCALTDNIYELNIKSWIIAIIDDDGNFTPVSKEYTSLKSLLANDLRLQ